MRIGEGNIFKTMRLVLPEHRDLMRKLERMATRRAPPILTEDRWEEMHYTLSSAIAEETRVRVTLFDEYEDRVMEGIPTLSEQSLRLRDGCIFHRVPLLRMTNVESV